MLVKTFQAATMAEALRLVKADLGPDAMILSTKKERQGGFLGFFSKQVIKVTAAIDPQRPPSSPPPPVRERPERDRSTKEEFESSMMAPLARELRELREKVEALAKRDDENRQRPPDETQHVEEPSKGTDVGGINLNNIPRHDLEEIKKLLLNTLTKGQDGSVKTVQFPEASANLAEVQPIVAPVEDRSPLIDELERQGIDREVMDKIIATINTMPMEQEEAGVVGRLGAAFGRLIKFTGTLRLKKNVPRIIALVGPTGVGKTTTTAKLAAMYALNRGNKVALITMDIFRVGAVEQLKTYTKIMGIPLEVASTPKELERAVERHAESDLILVDTAGRSHKDTEKLEETKNFLDAIQAEIYLCLSATTKDRELVEILKRFNIFSVGKVVFTKLDECESFGCIVNLLLKESLQIAYFTTGQRVPEDIEVATSAKLAELILKGAEE